MNTEIIVTNSKKHSKDNHQKTLKQLNFIPESNKTHNFIYWQLRVLLIWKDIAETKNIMEDMQIMCHLTSDNQITGTCHDLQLEKQACIGVNLFKLTSLIEPVINQEKIPWSYFEKIITCAQQTKEALFWLNTDEFNDDVASGLQQIYQALVHVSTEYLNKSNYEKHYSGYVPLYE